jgi:hypothetical protein
MITSVEATNVGDDRGTKKVAEKIGENLLKYQIKGTEKM